MSLVFSFSSYLELKWHFQHCCWRRGLDLCFLFYQMWTELAMTLLTCFYSAGRERVWELLCLRLRLPALPSEALSPASWGWGGALHNWWCKPVSLEMWGSPGSLCNSRLCSRLETAFWFQKFWILCVCGGTIWLDCLSNLPALFKWGNRHLCVFDIQ